MIEASGSTSANDRRLLDGYHGQSQPFKFIDDGSDSRSDCTVGWGAVGRGDGSSSVSEGAETILAAGDANSATQYRATTVAAAVTESGSRPGSRSMRRNKACGDLNTNESVMRHKLSS